MLFVVVSVSIGVTFVIVSIAVTFVLVNFYGVRGRWVHLTLSELLCVLLFLL